MHLPSQEKLLTHQCHHLTSLTFLLTHLVPLLLLLIWMVVTNYLAVMVAACVVPEVRKGQLPQWLQRQVLGQLLEQGQGQAWGLDQGLDQGLVES